MCFFLSACEPHAVPGTYGGHKRASNPLKLELRTIFGYLVDVGTLNPGTLQEQQMLVTAEPALQPLNSWAIFVLLGSIQVFLASISGPTILVLWLTLFLFPCCSHCLDCLLQAPPSCNSSLGQGDLWSLSGFFPVHCRVYVGMGVEVPVIKCFCVDTLAVRSWSQTACTVDIPVVTLIWTRRLILY